MINFREWYNEKSLIESFELTDIAKLYRKIVEKLLKQYNIQKTIRTYSSKDGNYDIQNFLLEMHQNVIYIGIE